MLRKNIIKIGSFNISSVDNFWYKLIWKISQIYIVIIW
jgi:hypothetical protein